MQQPAIITVQAPSGPVALTPPAGGPGMSISAQGNWVSRISPAETISMEHLAGRLARAEREFVEAQARVEWLRTAMLDALDPEHSVEDVSAGVGSPA